MEALAAVGLASNIINFIDSGAKLCSLIKEYSSTSGAPEELISISKRLELVLSISKGLDEPGRACLEHEKLALKICTDKAEELRALLESLKIEDSNAATGKNRRRWLCGRRASVDKGWKAFQTLRRMDKLEKFQISLGQILDLIMMQQQSRVEGSALRVEGKADTLIENSTSILKGLNELQTVTAQKPVNIPSMQMKPVFIVPFSRNTRFLGREALLLELEKRLASPASPGPRQVRKAALYGLGGIGKSQIALEYAYRQNQQIPNSSVFWIHAPTVARFEESYKRIAADFELPGWDNFQVDVLLLVRNWFEGQYQLPWLMVIDNVDDTQIFSKSRDGRSILEFLPQVADGSILYTSRNRDVAVDLVGNPITVPSFSAENSRKLLMEGAQGTSTDSEKDELLAELDHLPLAITQAASYMKKRQKSIPQYLKLYQDSETSKFRLLEHKFISFGRENATLDSVATTWLISFGYIRMENPRAADLLFLMSILDRESIPVSLLLQEGENPVEFDEAIGMLEAYSFVTVDGSGLKYSMHRLVQTATRGWLYSQETGAASVVFSRAISILSSRFPDGEFESWETCALYLPHAESVLARTLQASSEGDKMARALLLANIAQYLVCQGNYHLAELRFRESLDTYKIFGKEGLRDALRLKCKLAHVIELQGHKAESIAIFRETLEAQEKLFGLMNPDTLETADDLAQALSDTMLPENWQESELLARRALAGLKSLLPENHVKILNSMSTLGWTLYREGKLAESEILLRECLQQREITLGRRHPETHATANDLAVVLQERSAANYEEAMQLMQSSAQSSSMISGKEHPSTITTYINLCSLLVRQGRYDEAEERLRHQLVLCNKVLGKNHQTTTFGVILMGEMLIRLEKLEMCRSFILKELSERASCSETDQVDLLTLENLLGYVYEGLDQHEEAEKAFKRVMTGRSKIFRLTDSTQTLQSMHDLARVLWRQQKNGEAECILSELVTRRERLLGDSHSQTLLSARFLGHCLYSQEKYNEAERWYRIVLSRQEKQDGSDDLDVLVTRQLVETSVGKQEKWDEMEILCRETLAIRQRLAPDDFRTLKTASNLWHALEKQGKAESETVFNELLEKIMSMPETFMEGPSYRECMSAEEDYNFRLLRNGRLSLDTLKAHARVAAWYKKWGGYERAEEIYWKALKEMEIGQGIDCEVTQELNHEFAEFLGEQGKHLDAANVRRRAEQQCFWFDNLTSSLEEVNSHS